MRTVFGSFHAFSCIDSITLFRADKCSLSCIQLKHDYLKEERGYTVSDACLIEVSTFKLETGARGDKLMIAHLNSSYVLPEEYLKAEQGSPSKHEYRQGLVYVMPGASNAHVLIAVNLVAMLRNHVRGSGCRVYTVDTKVRIETVNIYYYPDVAISCDARDRAFEDFCAIPV